MLIKRLMLALCVAGSLCFCAAVSAEAYKMFRYTDASGKRCFANSMDDVPPEFRLSASAVMVLKDVPPAEPEDGAVKEKAANGGAVTVLSLNLTATEEGKCGFNGEVKNGMNDKAENAMLHIEVKTKDATKTFDVPLGAAGALNAGETVKITRVTDVPAADLAGYSYNVTWQTARVEALSAKPAQAQTPAQTPAEAAKENPADQAPAAPPKRYRTRTHPVTPPAGEKK